jgi:hypothetical protein
VLEWYEQIADWHEVVCRDRPGFDAPGTLPHVIVRGIEKRRIVDDRVDRDNFVSRMGQIAHETETVIYAWALMTNHAHILLLGKGL